MMQYKSRQLKNIPSKLCDIPQPAKQLFIKGRDISDLGPTVSIVGTRRPTNYGTAVTRKFAYELSKLGITIVSGMALGVDAIAHRAALDAGGRTIAVLPCGIDSFYPQTNTGLGMRILESGGTILSEYDGDERFINKGVMIERNRIVAALSDALIITEAAEKSGTTSTANFALDQGRTVLVVPGNINSVMSRGTNNLIKQGAVPVTSVTDIIDTLGLSIEKKIDTYQPKSDDEAIILRLIKDGIIDKNEILKKSGLNPAKANIVFTKLEIAKVI